MGFQSRIAPYTYSGTSFTMKGGGFVMSNGDIGGSGCLQNTSLTSPSFNTASASLLYLEFYQYYRDYSATPTDSAIVEVFNGTAWIKVQSLDVTTGTGTAPALAKIDISTLKNNAMQIRFRSMGSWPWYWAFDNVRVYSPLANDIGVTSIVSPFGDCGLNAATQVTVTVSNFGSGVQTSIPVKYRVGSGSIVSQTFTGNLAPGASDDFTFTTTQDMSANGDYFITAWTSLNGDVIIQNDSIKNVKVSKGSAAFGTVGFGGYNGTNLSTLYPGWKQQNGLPPAGTSSAWRPATTAQYNFFGTNNTACINLYTTSRKEWIMSPSFVPNSSSGLVFYAGVTNWQTPEPDQMGSDDQVKVMISSDCGNSWTPLKTFDNSSGLINKLFKQTVPLSAYAGQEVRIGFYATDGPVDDPEDYDFHIDSIQIRNLPAVDMAASVITSPVSDCGVTNAQVTVNITNLGTQSISGFPICLKINNLAPICQNYSGTLGPNEQGTFTFTGISQLNTAGDYQLRAYTNATGDADRQNDTSASYFFQNLPLISTFPYQESFENGNGGWIPGGTFSSWAIGKPEKTIIQSAAQGIRAYVTGGLGTGSYNSGERSFVESPCIDFTNIANPVFEMKAWWASEFSEDGALLQSSINDGQTWQTVGLLNEVTNWYNDNTIEALSIIGNPLQRFGWSGGLNDNFGSNGWRLVRNELKNLGGKPSVKLRIFFGAGANISGDGFAFDDIRISEKKDADIAFAGLDRPQISGCGLSDTTRFQVRIQNVGKNPITQATFGYRIVGRPVVQQQASNLNIAPGSFYVHTFSTTENLNQLGTYSVRTWAKTPSDGFLSNDSSLLFRIEKRGELVDTVDFDGLVQTAANLSILLPGWAVGYGASAPSGNSSQWRGTNLVQSAFYGKTVARVAMQGSARAEWLISPAYRIQPNAFLNFSVATADVNDTINDPTGGFEGTDDKLRILVTTDCGASWTEVFQVKAGDGVSRIFKNFKAALSAYNGKEIRFAFQATSGPVADVNFYDVLLNNIFIESLAPKDVGVTAINAPATSCGLNESVTIQVTLRNFGSQPVANIPIAYKVNQNPPVFAVFAGPLASGASSVFTFTQTADLSLPQPYTLRAYTFLNGDSLVINDESSVQINRFVAPVPVQSLAGYDGTNLSSVWNGWAEAKGAVSPVLTNSGWTSGLVAGQNSFKVTLANGLKNDWILSPGIKITDGNFLRFRAGQFSVGGVGSAQFDVDDSVSVLVSTNCGQTWKKLFKIGNNMNPPISNSMTDYAVSLAAYAGQEVRFGWVARDGSRNDFTSDIYINGIEISSSLTQDAGPVQFFFDPPITNNSFLKDSVYSVRAKITNFGALPVSSVPVSFDFPGLTLSANLSGSLASGQSQEIILGNFIPATVGSNFRATLYTALPGDQAVQNDSLSFVYSVTQPVSTTLDVGAFGLSFTPALVQGNTFIQNITYQVRVTVNNFGSQLATNVPVSVQFPGFPLLSATLPIPLQLGAIQEISVGSITPTVVTPILIAKAFTTLGGDQNVQNDTLIRQFSVITAFGENVQAPELKLYPNPAGDEISLSGFAGRPDCRISIRDMAGRELSGLDAIPDASGILSLPLKEIPPGIYSIHIQTRNSAPQIMRFARK